MTMYAGMKKKLHENLHSVRVTAWFLTGVCVIMALFMTQVARSTRGNTLADDFSLTHGNQITQGLVDMFMDGRVAIIDDPENPHIKLLESLDNPYDWFQRNEAGYHGPWDHLYYNGKIYSYYGIAPVLTLFLPYTMLTGYYFPSVWAVFLYGIIGIIFLSKTYMIFMRKFFPNVPGGLVIAGLMIMQASSGIWYCFPTPNFYEIAQNSGFAAVTAGAYFLFASNIVGGGRLSYWRLVLAATFLAFGVLCRPTLALYCIVAVMIIAYGFMKLLKNSEITRTVRVNYLLCALVPFVILGGMQMIYNYMRFDNFFEFGHIYSITINDFTNVQFHPRFATLGYWNYIFMPPAVTPSFPFFSTHFQGFNNNGWYFVATITGTGLLFRALPVFSYIYAGKAVKHLPNENRIPIIAIFVMACIISPIAIIFSIWSSGYGVRYSIDFGWQMLLGAYCIAFLLYSSVKGKNLKRHLYNLFIVCTVISVIISTASVYPYFRNALEGISYEFAAFERIFEWWR